MQPQPVAVVHLLTFDHAAKANFTSFGCSLTSDLRSESDNTQMHDPGETKYGTSTPPTNR